MPGNKTVSSIRIGALTLLGVLAGAQVMHRAPAIEVPAGFDARIYARDIAGARDLRVDTDGTLRLRGDSESFEITPPRDDSPRMVMRVASEIQDDTVIQATARAVPLAPQAPVTNGPVLPETVALARELARQRFTDVALAPDGTLFVSDARAGVVYQVRRISL